MKSELNLGPAPLPDAVTRQHDPQRFIPARARLRSVIVFGFDLFAVIPAFLGGVWLRYNFSLPADALGQLWLVLALLLLVQAAACHWAGLARGMWSFASLADLRRVLSVVVVSALALALVLVLNRGAYFSIPRSMLVLYPTLLLLIMAGGRVAWRMWREHRVYGVMRKPGNAVVVVDAGAAAAALVRDLERSPDWHVVALVDDDPQKWGRELSGHPVRGNIGQLPAVLAQHQARHVILAMPSAPARVRKHVADLAMRAGAHVYTVPGLEDLMRAYPVVTDTH